MDETKEYIEVINFVPSAVYEIGDRTRFEFYNDSIFDIEYDGEIFRFSNVNSSTRRNIEYINDFCFEDVELTFESEDKYLEVSLLDLHNDIINHPDYVDCVNVLFNKKKTIKDKEFFNNFEKSIKGMSNTEGDETLVSDYELNTFMAEITTFNTENYKESAINVALDTGDKEMFMRLTGGQL